MFQPEDAIVGFPHCNQRWPSGKRKKSQFGSFLLQDCRHSILKAILGLKIAINTVANATNISSLVNKIRQNRHYTIVTTFFCVDEQ